MDILIGTFILAAITCLLIIFLKSNDGKNSSIPYATYGSYPIVGHLFPFIRDRSTFLMNCKQRYGQCFKIRIFNTRITLVLAPSDWTTIIRHQSFYLPTAEKGKRLVDVANSFADHPEVDAESHRQYVQYLKNRDGLRPMIIEFVGRIFKLIQHEKMTLENNGTLSEWIPSGLLEFSQRMIFEPSTLALFGEIEPLSFEDDFKLFNDKLPYFVTPIPRWIFSWLFPKELKARSKLNSSWLKSLHPSRESEFIQAQKTLFFDNPDYFSERDIRGGLTGFLLASMINTIPAVFWSLFYILRDDKAIEVISQEIDTYLPICSLDNNSDKSLVEEWTPEQLNSCVYLEIAVNEVLRLAGGTLLTRKCHQETQIVLQDGRTLIVKPDESVMYFSTVSHHDPNLFPEPNKFIFDRFVNKNADSIPGFTPFGGGKTICPGRFFARNEMKICLAILLRYMEYKFVDKEIIPIPKLSRVGLGVAPPNQDIPIMYRYKK